MLFVVLLFAAVSVRGAWAGASVTYEYDKYGNCKAVTTVAGNGQVLEKTTYTYDNYRRCTSMVESAHLLADAPPPERTWTWTYERWFGDQPYDPYAHTSKQWRVQIQPAFDGANNRNVTARFFDANDQIVDEYTGVIQGPGGMYNGPDIEVHSFGYDENGQKNRFVDPRGRVTDYTYDVRNRLRETVEPKRADQSTRPTTTTEYDFAGNKTDVTFPDGQSQHWRYYDAFGQPRQFIDERNNVTDLNYWSWGPMKKLESVTTHRDKDGGGTEPQRTQFYYDGIGRPQWTIFPDGSTELTTYKFGQMDAFKTRKNQAKRVNYDARGREISHTWDAEAAPAISRSWDDANRLSTICNIFSTIDYRYDGRGLVQWEGNTIAGSGARLETIYQRYHDGAVAEIKYPAGVLVQRDYTSRGQLKRVHDDTGGWWKVPVEYTYLRDGKVEYQNSRPGVQTKFGYDERGFTSSIKHSRSGQELSRRNYYRDARDRIVAFQKGSGNAINPKEDGRGDHYWYDAEGQLTDGYYGAVDPVANPHSPVRIDYFSYDALGNRKGWNHLASRGEMTFTRKDNGLNQYRAWWNYSIINHDDDLGGTWGTPGAANGVMMQDGWITAGFNALNQPMMIWSASNPGGAFTWFGYDPLGRCVKRWLAQGDGSGANGATYLYYDGWNLIQEGASATNVARLYFHGGRVDEIVASYNAATDMMAYHYYDASGHATLLTDWQGNLMEQYEYDAFGQPYFFSSTAQPLNSSPHGNRFLFTGREWLAELKLYDYRNRMYQPELGRFLQPDPIQFKAGDYNLYRYCKNDPVNKTDPLGLVPPADGLVDLPKDVLRAQFKAGQANAADSSNPAINKDAQGRRVEFRRDGYKKGDTITDGVKKGYWDGGPKADPPDNPNGGKRVYITHSHVTGSHRHLEQDKNVADGAKVPSGVTYSGYPNFMEVYVPRADGGGRGGTFYTRDGIRLFDKNKKEVLH